MTICARLFDMLDKRNIGQKSFADALGVSQQTVNNWKTRGTDPPAKLLIPICEYLDISVHYFLTGTNEMSYYSPEAREILNEFLRLNTRNQRKAEGYIYELSDAQEGKANAEIQADA